MLEQLKALHLKAEEEFLDAPAASDKANELDLLARFLEKCIDVAERIYS